MANIPYVLQLQDPVMICNIVCMVVSERAMFTRTSC